MTSKRKGILTFLFFHLSQIAMVSPGMASCEYTMNTLRYADRSVLSVQFQL